MTAGEMLACAIGAQLLLYISARVITRAVLRTIEEFEEERKHGQ